MAKKKEVQAALPLDPKNVVSRWNEVKAQLALLGKEEAQLKKDLMIVIGDEDDLDIELDIPYTLHRVIRDLSSLDMAELQARAIHEGVDLMKLPAGWVEINVNLTEVGANALVEQKSHGLPGLTKEDLKAAFKPKFSEYITVKPKKED